MTSSVLRTAWYRFTATFGRQWGGYLTVLLLIGLLGGLAMGSVAGARRTLASPAVYAASANLVSFGVGTGLLGQTNSTSGYDPRLVDTIAHLPHVSHVTTITGLNLVALNKDGSPNKSDANPGNGSGSVDGAYFHWDKVTVLQGRMADPGSAHEFVVNSLAAQGLGLHVGQVVRFGIYTDAQTQLSGFGTASVPPQRTIDAKLVGVVIDPTTVAQDDVDSGTTLQIFTPALTRQLLSCCVNYSFTGVTVKGDTAEVSAVEREVRGVLPRGAPVAISTTADSEAKASRAVKPEAIAIGVFGGIAGLVALIVASQVIGRQLRLGAEERSTMRALGADPVEAVVDGLLGVVLSIVAGSLVALAVAVALSPIAPIGVIRPVYPHPGVAWDWTVLGLGFVVLLVVLSAIATVMAYRQAPLRLERRRARTARTESTSAGLAASWGLPAPAVEGVRFALDPGAGRTSAPVRSAIFGTVLALSVVVATVTFGASLNSLVSHPNLYGWNWDYVLAAGGGSGDIPAQTAAPLLAQDRSVGSWSGIYFAQLQIDGQSVPALGAAPGTAVGPPILSGHGLDGPQQIVLGAVTLGQLGKKVGDTVIVSNGATAPTRVRVVGTATMPTIAGGAGGQHLEMGSGAVVPTALIPPSARNPFADPMTGPQVILVRLKDGANHQAALRSLQRIADSTSNPSNFGVAVVSVLRPAEIVNYRSLGTTPVVLGLSLAAGAVAALMLTLVASVRRRRRDLAVFKTLGFTRRQLAATVAWQSSVSVFIGVVAGVPLGVIAGRQLWNVFATEINAVPAPTVPAGWIVAISVGALVLANVVASVPGRIAARTPTALVLRAD
ncbi:MAG TPA: FtsX-like permease family protein [Acidimicrobiales bacterium]|nr:FtsX-like permease family protein [Acidimicrobiales bacterium]